MNNPLTADEEKLALKVIRLTLMKFENGINAGDDDLLRTLFIEGAVVMTPTVRVPASPHNGPRLSQLLWGVVDCNVSCMLAVNDVLLLSPMLACARITFHLHLIIREVESERTGSWLVILQRNTPVWLFGLLYADPNLI